MKSWYFSIAGVYSACYKCRNTPKKRVQEQLFTVRYHAYTAFVTLLGYGDNLVVGVKHQSSYRVGTPTGENFHKISAAELLACIGELERALANLLIEVDLHAQHS